MNRQVYFAIKNNEMRLLFNLIFADLEEEEEILHAFNEEE